MTNKELLPLLHLLSTLLISMDEMENLPKVYNPTSYKHELKVNTKKFLESVQKYIKQLSPFNDVVSQIIENVDASDYEEYIGAKKRIIRAMQYADFETVKEFELLIRDAGYRMEQLEAYELMLNTHVPHKDLREKYREKLGYSEAQFEEFKRLNA